MKTKSTVAERILKVLAGGRPTSIRDLERASGASTGTIYVTLSKLKQAKKARPVPGMRGMWELPASSPATPKPPAAAGKPKPIAKPAAPVNGARVLGAIEKGIPIPSIHGPRGDVVARLRELEVGDSFYTTVPHATFAKSAKRIGIQITRRKEREGFRILRVK